MRSKNLDLAASIGRTSATKGGTLLQQKCGQEGEKWYNKLKQISHDPTLRSQDIIRTRGPAAVIKSADLMEAQRAAK